MKTTLFMAMSADGFVADEHGSEDFLPHEGWIEMLKLAKQYGHIIWGRKTYEQVKSWGENFLKDIEQVPIIIVSTNHKTFDEKNVTVCSSPTEAQKTIEQMGFEKAFLSGGPKLNSSFAKEELIDEIIININPTLLSNGIRLFPDPDVKLKLFFTNAKKINPDIIQLHYFVL
ncbi:MAG: dihydrofolate reductase family protein [Patescibacteria group bacterium]